MTSDTALEHAVRLLDNAERETDRGLMERWNLLADSWISVAELLAERERV